MADAPDETALREELVAYYKRVEAIGLNEMSSGNLSVRFGEGMLISPNGATAESITVDTVVETTFDGRWSGERRPSSEWRMHAAIYEKHADAQGVHWRRGGPARCLLWLLAPDQLLTHQRKGEFLQILPFLGIHGTDQPADTLGQPFDFRFGRLTVRYWRF